MNRYVHMFLMAIAFDLYWTLVVLFRERGLFLWLTLAILACLMLVPVHRLYALLLAAAGSGLDALWAWIGLIHFNGNGLLPLWMVALWLMFATVWTKLLSVTTFSRWLLTLLATFSAPVAYLLGKHLGAITFLEPPPIVLLWMAWGWLGLMLFFLFLMGKRR